MLLWPCWLEHWIMQRLKLLGWEDHQVCYWEWWWEIPTPWFWELWILALGIIAPYNDSYMCIMYLEEQYLTITDYYSHAGPNVLTFYQLKRFYALLFMKESVSSLIMCSFLHLPSQNLSLNSRCYCVRFHVVRQLWVSGSKCCQKQCWQGRWALTHKVHPLG